MTDDGYLIGEIQMRGGDVFEVYCSAEDIARFIRDFDFSGYALADLNQIKHERWVTALARYILARMRD